MSETLAAVLDDEGLVVNVVVVDPETVETYAEAVEADPTPAAAVRVLTAAERDAGVTLGWRRAGNGRLVPPPEPEPPAPEPEPAP